MRLRALRQIELDTPQRFSVSVGVCLCIHVTQSVCLCFYVFECMCLYVCMGLYSEDAVLNLLRVCMCVCVCAYLCVKKNISLFF